MWPPPSSASLPRYPVICADGGANLLYDLRHQKKTNGETNSVNLAPTHIVGDLDSVRPEVLRHYESRGTLVVSDVSDASNDFHKALCVCEAHLEQLGSRGALPPLAIVVVGGHGGRFDQTLGNLNVLYTAAQRGRAIFWLDVTTAILVLPTGSHRISVQPTLEGPLCGLVPIGAPVDSVSTSGLRWNVCEQRLACGVGGLISTSNQVMGDSVVVHTSQPLLWTIELRIGAVHQAPL